jgi:ribosome-associated protein
LNKEIIHKELIFSASRCSGKGGQNVNKVNSKVSLKFIIATSEGLTKEEKTLILEKLRNKINTEGELYLDCETERSQLANKDKLTKKFFRILQKSLIKPKPRKKTKPSLSSIKNRIEEKKQRGGIKQLRRKTDFNNE